MAKTAIVTGGSSGIGREIAALLSKCGYDVFEFSRRNIPLDNVVHIYADITDSKTVKDAVTQVIQKSGRIDLLINNAGSGISGAVEFTDDESVLYTVNTLFLGTDRVTRACLPYIRESKGRIVNISSAAAVLPIPFQTYYSAMKAGINAYTMALANEVSRFGVTVCALMPGDTGTGFTKARKCIEEGDVIYGGAIRRSVGRMEKDEQNGASSLFVAKKAVKIATKKHVKPLYSVKAEYKLFCVLSKIVPSRVLNFIIGRLYAK